MKITTTHLVYFSATNTTQKIVRTIGKELEGELVEHNLTLQQPQEKIELGAHELLVVGVPVFAGRVPALVVPALQKFQTQGGAAILVGVYGNRDYDDALLELQEITRKSGFRILACAAFIAQHSMFPAVGANRPDAQDLAQIRRFGEEARSLLQTLTSCEQLTSLSVPGNSPYKTVKSLSLHPLGNEQCNNCGTCVKQCPVDAIPVGHPRETRADRCISCGRCIAVCPQKARAFTGPLYEATNQRFTQAFSKRREPFTLFARILA